MGNVSSNVDNVNGNVDNVNSNSDNVNANVDSVIQPQEIVEANELSGIVRIDPRLSSEILTWIA